MIFAQKSVGNHFKNSQAHSQDTQFHTHWPVALRRTAPERSLVNTGPRLARYGARVRPRPRVIGPFTAGPPLSDTRGLHHGQGGGTERSSVFSRPPSKIPATPPTCDPQHYTSVAQLSTRLFLPTPLN